jgi:hypothetical protein
MSCSPHDLRDYLLNELKAGEGLEVERHLKACATCRLEIEQLQLTRAVLLSLPEEEIPRRIGFVSDKIFEPSWLRGWWRSAWAPAWGLVAAAVVFAILFRPVPPPARPVAGTVIDPDQLRTEIAQQIVRAVAASEDRQAHRTAELLAAAEKRYAFERQADRLAVEEYIDVLKKRLNVTYMALANREARP